MEDVLGVYHRAYDAAYPVICMDESNKQLVGEVAPAIPMASGHPELIDHEYVRKGVADIFLEVEPLAGKRHIAITERRGRMEWAEFTRSMLEDRYPQAKRIILILDNLNTHGIASLYAAFPPEHARRLAERLEIHYTPKHGSWLNIAEIELSVLSRQCLGRRIETIETMREEVSQWVINRNNNQTRVKWQFSCEDARIKLRRLYPTL